MGHEACFLRYYGGIRHRLEGEESFLPGHRRGVTLTANGIRFIAERFPTLLPDVLEEDIVDKSKAGVLVKSIVCIQAAWLIAQCIGRLATDLPITLLEVRLTSPDHRR